MSRISKRKLADITRSVEVLPLLAELTMQASGSPEAFCQVALLALCQLDSVLQQADTSAVLWHGQMEEQQDGLLFSSKLMLPVGQCIGPLDKIVDFFEAGIVTNAVYKQRLWKVGYKCSMTKVQTVWPKGSGGLVSAGILGMLSFIKELKRDMAEMIQEMFMTNQGVIAMVEEMALGVNPDGSKQGMPQLLAQHLETNRQLIERLQEKERALQHADRLATLGRLVAGVAHEINNPLTFIKMNTELLEKGLIRFIEKNDQSSLLEEQYKRHIMAISRGTERIENIVSGLKFFSRQEKKDKTGVLLTKCLEEAWLLVASNKELSNDVDMIATIEPGIMIYGNAQQLEQVLINLIYNALKAIHKRMPLKGRVSVSASIAVPDIEWVVIMVTDNGCGITQSVLPKIFEPFYTSDDENGTGLGLSIVQGIIYEHGGQIKVTSEVGKGTIFTIKLPSWQIQKGDR